MSNAESARKSGSDAEPLLEVQNLTKTFGGLVAVDGLSFDIDRNEIMGLIGPNGAGKTTVFNLIMGVLKQDKGDIYYNGERISDLRTFQRVNLGLARTYQTPNPFSELSVANNIRACMLPNSLGVMRTKHSHQERIEDIAERVGLTTQLSRYPDELTPGDLRRLEIAKALAQDPEFLLLDEVFAGVTHEEASSLAGLIETLRDDEGYTFLVVDHVMRILMPLVDSVVVMNYGSKLAEGDPDTVAANETVREIYFGQSGRES